MIVSFAVSNVFSVNASTTVTSTVRRIDSHTCSIAVVLNLAIIYSLGHTHHSLYRNNVSKSMKTSR